MIRTDYPASPFQETRGRSKERITAGKFGWADEYYAASVSESVLDIVRNYIDTQEAHHKKLAFQDEYDGFMSGYKLVNEG